MSKLGSLEGHELLQLQKRGVLSGDGYVVGLSAHPLARAVQLLDLPDQL